MGGKDNRISLDRVAYVHYQHPDLANAKKFLTDFGFNVVKETENRVYYGGFGVDHFVYIAEQSPDKLRHFIGGAWIVETFADLEKAITLPGASGVEDLTTPGGGKAVKVPDPVGGVVTLIHGQEPRDIAYERAPKTLDYNTWDIKRRKGEFQRPGSGPSKVHKLGHYGFEVPAAQYETVLNWYLTTFTLAPTDSLFNPEDGKDVMNFIHLDKGDEFVDHHSFFLARGRHESGIRVHHSSYEVDDFDSELSGHNHLEKKGWTNCFGVGRHLLGSQIFDYWFDSSNFVVEHYADGDLVNSSTPHEREAAVPDSIAIWGPNIPLAFLTRNIDDIGKFPGPPGAPAGPPTQVGA